MKYSNCPHCGGKLRSETLGWICEKCRGFIDMQGNFHEHVEKPFMPPMTNADRIRAMSDKELAAVIMCPMEFAGIKDLCAKNPGHTCVECSLRWLQEPVKEDA
jgi:hypothetical protein